MLVGFSLADNKLKAFEVLDELFGPFIVPRNSCDHTLHDPDPVCEVLLCDVHRVLQLLWFDLDLLWRYIAVRKAEWAEWLLLSAPRMNISQALAMPDVVTAHQECEFVYVLAP